MTTASTARKASAQASDAPASRSRTQVAPKAPAALAGPAKKKPLSTAPAKSSLNKPAMESAATAKGEKKKDKGEKIKVVRDSFTIPKAEYAQIAVLKKRAMDLGQAVKKSELIRAGLLLLAAAPDASLRKALARVPTLKTGRPGKA